MDFTVAAAGPFAVAFLADMGAEVIRIDNIHHPDLPTRGPLRSPAHTGPRPYERASIHAANCRNRKSATFAVKHPRMRELLLQLATMSDVIVCNHTAGTLERMGLGYEAVAARNPKIVMIDLPAFGNTGPSRGLRAYGDNLEAAAGHTALRGYPDSDLTHVSIVTHSDAVGGATAAFAVLCALLHRSVSEKGQYIDLSQQEAMLTQMPQAVMEFAMNGGEYPRLGNRDSITVQGVYRCAGEDHWIAISIESDVQWRVLCDLMMQPALSDDPAYCDMASRRWNQNTVDKLIGEWTIDRDRHELFHLLQQFGIPAAPVLGFDDSFNEPHLRARGYFEAVTHPCTGPVIDGKESPGTHDYPGPSFDFSKTPIRILGPAPTLGQHNEYVFRNLLGVSAEEYAEFIGQQLIGELYPT